MPKTNRVARIAIALLVLTAGFGPQIAAAHGPEEDTETAEDVRFLQLVLESQGHLNASVHWASVGNDSEAEKHAGHPGGQYWSIIGPQIEAANASLAEDLETELQALPEKSTSMEADAYREHIHTEVLPLLDRALEAVIEEDRLDERSLHGAAVANLFERIEGEYANAMNEEGEVVSQGEYWDAQGFSAVIERHYDSEIRAQIEEDEDAEELAEFIETVQQRVDEKVAPDQLNAATGTAADEMREYTGVETHEEEGEESEGGAGPAATIEQIETNLDEAVEQYENGEVDAAKQTVSETYLTLFEGLEGPLIEQRPELVETLEAQFNEELPGQIDSGAEPSAVESTVASMKSNLAEAEAVLADQETATITVDETSSTDAGGPGFVALGAIGALLVVGLFTRR